MDGWTDGWMDCLLAQQRVQTCGARADGGWAVTGPAGSRRPAAKGGGEGPVGGGGGGGGGGGCWYDPGAGEYGGEYGGGGGGVMDKAPMAPPMAQSVAVEVGGTEYVPVGFRCGEGGGAYELCGTAAPCGSGPNELAP
jgi:hypothetical protein